MSGTRGRKRVFDWDEARRLRAEGLTVKEVAVRLGVSAGAVSVATCYSRRDRSPDSAHLVLSLAERVAQAKERRLRGHTLREIADEFHISLTTASNWVAARSCEKCGLGVVVRPGAVLCSSCAAKWGKGGVQQAWPRDRIIAAAVRFFVANGRAPTTFDWTRSTEDYPDHNVVMREFGSWSAGIRAAGLTPKKTGGRGQDRGERGGKLVPRTVANGFTVEQEIAYLSDQQRVDERAWRVFEPSLDALLERYIADRHLSYTDAWKHAVHRLVDRRREIDAWAEAA